MTLKFWDIVVWLQLSWCVRTKWMFSFFSFFLSLYNELNFISFVNDCGELIMAIVGRLKLFREDCHHIAMVIMLTTVVLDVLWMLSSDKVFKSLDKIVNFHSLHLIERLCFCKAKLASKQVLPRKYSKWHNNSDKISLQRWFINYH